MIKDIGHLKKNSLRKKYKKFWDPVCQTINITLEEFAFEKKELLEFHTMEKTKKNLRKANNFSRFYAIFVKFEIIFGD